MGWSVLAPAGFDRMGIEFPTCRGVFPLVRGLPIVDFITTRYAGLLACRDLDDALGLTETANECLQESRSGRNVQHQFVALLRQSG